MSFSFCTQGVKINQRIPRANVLSIVRWDRPNHPEDEPPFILPHPLPRPPKKVKARLPTTPLSSPTKAAKRSAPDDDDIAEQQPAKRLKTSANGNGADPYTPRKKRQLEEDGLIIVDGPEGDRDDAEVIVID